MESCKDLLFIWTMHTSDYTLCWTAQRMQQNFQWLVTKCNNPKTKLEKMNRATCNLFEEGQNSQTSEFIQDFFLKKTKQKLRWIISQETVCCDNSHTRGNRQDWPIKRFDLGWRHIVQTTGWGETENQKVFKSHHSSVTSTWLRSSRNYFNCNTDVKNIFHMWPSLSFLRTRLWSYLIFKSPWTKVL